ncbi:MAG: hypothetical protein Q4F00_13345 [bacterium]|nr:hypothetical protein [bacterium]
MIKRLLVCRSLTLVCLAALMILMSACGTIEVKPQDDELPEGMLKEPVPDLSKRPDGLANECLKCLKRGQYDKVYTYFGPEITNSMSQDTFVRGISKYMATASTRQSYMVRELSSERVVGKVGVVRLVDRTSPNSKPWVWEFQEEYDGWKIRSLDLPPMMRYKERFTY